MSISKFKIKRLRHTRKIKLSKIEKKKKKNAARKACQKLACVSSSNEAGDTIGKP